MPRLLLERLNDILQEIAFLQSIRASLTWESFSSDETAKRAVVRSIEIIGEAAKAVPDDVRNLEPSIPWRNLAGMRNRLIHGYEGVDYAIVWDVVSNEIDALQRAVQRILAIQ